MSSSALGRNSNVNLRSHDRTPAYRVEDEPLIRGEGCFTDDFECIDALHACFVRSPHAHAMITHLDASHARQMPDVVAVYTGRDLEIFRYGSVSKARPVVGSAELAFSPYRPALASKRAMHVGEPVAVVIAQTLAAAQDAAETVVVEYESCEVVTEPCNAVSETAPQLWPETKNNVALDWIAPTSSNPDEIEHVFRSASYIAKLKLRNHRVAPLTLEPRALVATYDDPKDVLTLRCGTQGVASIRNQLAEAMGLERDKLRVVSKDVGGGFGMKAQVYPEYLVLLHAAKHLGQPVRWVATRSESFVSDSQGRDSEWDVELAIDSNGKFQALRVTGLDNLGAYVLPVAPSAGTAHVAGCLPGIYDIPLLSLHVRCVFTNTVPIGPYRGAGRPEANYLLERIVDEAAAITGIDRAEIRRRNIIQTIPYKTAFGKTYDSGRFAEIFETTLDAADYDGFESRRQADRKTGKVRGIGVACYLEISGAVPEEPARITFTSDSRVQLSIGAVPNGQGHLTVFGGLLADCLDLEASLIDVSYGDSSRDVPGNGVVASRSAMMVGGAVAGAADAVLEKARETAALLLQSAVPDIVYAGGRFSVKNTTRSVSLFEVAAERQELFRRSLANEPLDTMHVAHAGPSFPNGCHIVEVQIDPETGFLKIDRYTAVDDCGRILNETIVQGQIHGGVAQGVGQALGEWVSFDEQGQILSGSLMDYAVPRAELMPEMRLSHVIAPCLTNPLGVKGTGESGTTAATPALISAVLDALPQNARGNFSMPATPERIWRAFRA